MLLLAVAVLVVDAVLVRKAGRERRENQEELIFRSRQQLKQVFRYVAGRLESQSINSEQVDLKRAVQDLVGGRTLTAFEFRTSRTNSILVCLNPEQSKWVAPGSATDDIAAYWPIPGLAGTNPPGMVGIRFSGEIATVTNRPSWVPMDLMAK